VKRIDNGPLVLVIGVPVAAVIMGIVTLVLAFGNPDRPVKGPIPALDKRSWVNAEREEGRSAADDRAPALSAAPHSSPSP